MPHPTFERNFPLPVASRSSAEAFSADSTADPRVLPRCCALYALELKTREMTKLLEPVSEVAVSPDGQHVLTQRGPVGIEVFGAHSLQLEPTISRSIVPGYYSLRFSPDGRMLYGTS